MADKTDRRCFLARGVLGGAAAVGAVHASIEEKIFAAAVEEGTAAKPTTHSAAVCRAATSSTYSSAGCSSEGT